MSKPNIYHKGQDSTPRTNPALGSRVMSWTEFQRDATTGVSKPDMRRGSALAEKCPDGPALRLRRGIETAPADAQPESRVCRLI
jgi:hypothetical protein